jgi:hypothetical protein
VVDNNDLPDADWTCCTKIYFFAGTRAKEAMFVATGDACAG